MTSPSSSTPPVNDPDWVWGHSSEYLANRTRRISEAYDIKDYIAYVRSDGHVHIVQDKKWKIPVLHGVVVAAIPMPWEGDWRDLKKAVIDQTSF